MPKLENQNGYKDLFNSTAHIKTTFERIEKDERINPRTLKALRDYHTRIKNTRPPTQLKSINRAYWVLREIGKEPGKITVKDVEKWHTGLMARYDKGELKAGTLNTTIVFFKKFMRFNAKLRKGRYPNSVDWLEANFKDEREIRPEDLPTQDDIKRVIEMAQKDGTILPIRNQALIALMNDNGLRPSEVLALDLKDITQEENYLIINISQSKTKHGKRRLISYLAMPYVKKYLSLRGREFKGKNWGQYKDEPLFLDRYNNRLPHSALRMLLIRAFKKAGVKFPESKQIIGKVFRNCFAFRAGDYFSHSQLYNFMGWSRAIESVYSPRSHEQLIKPYFEMLKGENNPMMPKNCKCGNISIGLDFCEKCGNDLKALNILNSNPEQRTRVMREVLESLSESELYPLLDKWFESKKK